MRPRRLTPNGTEGIICLMETDGGEFFAFRDITCRIGNPPRRIGASASLVAGGVLAIKAPSGAGKTTMLRTLARLHPHLSGEAWLSGRSWRTFPPSLWRRRVILVGQEPARFHGTLGENLERPFRLGAVKREVVFNPAQARALLEASGLSPDLFDQDARLLSGGEAARMALVRALLLQPDVVLLDEPTASLDHGAAEAVCRLLAAWLSEGPPRAAVLVSHAGDEARFPLVTTLSLPPGEPA